MKKTVNIEKLNKELQNMFFHKWYTTLNKHIYDLIIKDILNIIERHECEK